MPELIILKKGGQEKTLKILKEISPEITGKCKTCGSQLISVFGYCPKCDEPENW